MNNNTCIVFDNVSVAYGSQQAVQNVSFSVNNGESLAIVGESGSGKSTLVRAAFGLLDGAQLSGRITVNGTDISTLSPKDWRQLRGTAVTMIFQNPGAYLNPFRTVENQIKDLFRAHNEPYDVQRVTDMLASVHLTDGERVLRSYPFQLSGGMQQRVAIALSLILQPGIIFADEPTSALDILVQSSILDLLKEVQQSTGAGIILVTHNVKAAARVADRIAVMHKGRLVEMGPAADIMSQPKDEYTRVLLDSVMKVV